MTDLEKAELELKEFLEKNPEMRQAQADLVMKMALLGHQDRLVFLGCEIQEQIKQLTTNLEKLKRLTK